MFYSDQRPLLHYTDQGQGPVIVFLHGFCETKEIWTEFVGPLIAHYRVVCFDLSGFGQNPALLNALTIADMAEDVYKGLKELQIEQCVMIGHSMGGYIGIAFAEKFGSKLLGLGLFHSTAQSDSAEKKQGRNKSIEFIERYGVEEFVEEFVGNLFYEGRHRDLREEIKHVIALGRTAPKSTVIECIKAMRDRKDRQKVLERIMCPVLFIVGRNDTAVNFAANTTQFSLPANATIHIFSHTGHMGMFERKVQTQKCIIDFVESALKAE